MGGEAFAPVELAGPAFNGAHGDAELAGGGGVAAPGAEFQVGAEGLESARGLAGGGAGKRAT
jgi:hypothetical protein